MLKKNYWVGAILMGLPEYNKQINFLFWLYTLRVNFFFKETSMCPNLKKLGFFVFGMYVYKEIILSQGSQSNRVVLKTCIMLVLN